jgi:hypothetical protein
MRAMGLLFRFAIRLFRSRVTWLAATRMVLIASGITLANAATDVDSISKSLEKVIEVREAYDSFKKFEELQSFVETHTSAEEFKDFQPPPDVRDFLDERLVGITDHTLATLRGLEIAPPDLAPYAVGVGDAADPATRCEAYRRLKDGTQFLEEETERLSALIQRLEELDQRTQVAGNALGSFTESMNEAIDRFPATFAGLWQKWLEVNLDYPAALRQVMYEAEAKTSTVHQVQQDVAAQLLGYRDAIGLLERTSEGPCPQLDDRGARIQDQAAKVPGDPPAGLAGGPAGSSAPGLSDLMDGFLSGTDAGGSDSSRGRGTPDDFMNVADAFSKTSEDRQRSIVKWIEVEKQRREAFELETGGGQIDADQRAKIVADAYARYDALTGTERTLVKQALQASGQSAVPNAAASNQAVRPTAAARTATVPRQNQNEGSVGSKPSARRNGEAAPVAGNICLESGGPQYDSEGHQCGSR